MKQIYWIDIILISRTFQQVFDNNSDDRLLFCRKQQKNKNKIWSTNNLTSNMHP